MFKFLFVIAAAILFSGCYEETVVERRSYRPRHHVYVSERPYRDSYYYGGGPRRAYYRSGYYDDRYYDRRPARGRVIVGF